MCATRREPRSRRLPVSAVVFVLIPAMLLIVSGGGCTSRRSTDFSRDQMVGVVYDETGTPVAGAIITVDRFRRGVSDTFGRFRVIGVPAGTRTVVVSADGYETAQTTVILENRTRLVRVDLVSLAGLADLAIAAVEQNRWEYLSGIVRRMAAVAPEDPRTVLVRQILDRRDRIETGGSP